MQLKLASITLESLYKTGIATIFVNTCLACVAPITSLISQEL
jgi:hypothetical protein